MNSEALEKRFPQSIEEERVRMLYEQIREGALSYYAWLVSILLVLIISDADIVGMVIWALLALVASVIEFKMLGAFFNTYPIDNVFIWERRKAISSSVEALIVSAGAMFLIDLDQHLAVYILITLLVLPAYVSALVLVASSKTYQGWMLALLIPIAVKLGLSGDAFYMILGGLILAGGIPSALFIGKQMHKEFLRTLMLRSENLELLETVKQERNRAEQASRDKTRFLASASHDLRQPIHALELFSDALEHQLTTPGQFEMMSKIKESAGAMNGLLYSLLDISKLDAGIVNVDKKAISLSNLILKVKQSLQHQADDKGLKVEVDCLPCGVMSDAVLLKSVLQNLLSNAIKYTDQGRVVISCKVSDGLVQLQVKDTGIGISASNLVHIYDEFFQIDNPERDRKKGLGLGLSIVKRTCDLLGHGLRASSTVGEGSCFTLSLEMADAIVGQVEEAATHKPKQIDATVLVIDDEDTILEGMMNILQPWGCHVLVAHNLDEALLQIQSEAVHIIIADYRLRDGQLGTDVVKALEASVERDGIPAIIVTGDTGPEQLADVKKSGFHVLHKPVAAIRMRALIQNLLKQARQKV